MTQDKLRELISQICSRGVRRKFASGQYGWTDYKIECKEYLVVIDDEENLKLYRHSGEKVAGYNSERSVFNWYGNDNDTAKLEKLLEEELSS